MNLQKSPGSFAINVAVVVLAAVASCAQATPPGAAPSSDGGNDREGGGSGGAMGSGGAVGPGGASATGGATGSGGVVDSDSGVAADSGAADSDVADSGVADGITDGVTDASAGFACGSATCDRTKQYCEHAPATDGGADRDVCVPLPAQCGSRATCACVYTACALACKQPNGAVTLVTPCIHEVSADKTSR